LQYVAERLDPKADASSQSMQNSHRAHARASFVRRTATSSPRVTRIGRAADSRASAASGSRKRTTRATWSGRTTRST